MHFRCTHVHFMHSTMPPARNRLILSLCIASGCVIGGSASRASPAIDAEWCRMAIVWAQRRRRREEGEEANKVQLARKDLRGMSASIYLAQEVGALLGRGDMLF